MGFFRNTVSYRELVLKAQAGDAEAFKQLFDSTHQKLFAFAVARTNSREDATDIVQETFIDLWRSFSNFIYRSDREFMAFLFLILKRKLVRYYKHRQHQTLELNNNLPATPAASTATDEYGLQNLIKDLRPEYAEVLQLRYWSGLPFHEIAEILNENTNTVKTWHRRAIKELHNLLSEYD